MARQDGDRAPGAPVSGVRPEPYRGAIDWTVAGHRLRGRQDWIAAGIEGPRVLDVECGRGDLAFALARRGFSVTAIDAAEDNIARARTALARKPAGIRDRISLVHGNFMQPDPSAEPFDSVVLDDVLHACADPAAALRAALARVREGGMLAVTVPIGRTGDERQQHAINPAAFVEMVRGLCRSEHFSVSDATVRFIGRRAPALADDWRAITPESLLEIADAALIAEQERYLETVRNLGRQVREAEDRLEAIRANPAMQLGRLVIDIVRRPWQVWRVPARLLKIWRDRYGRRAVARPAVEQLVDFPSFPVPAAKPASGLRIAAILDTFTESCLRHEAELLLLTRRRWKEQIALHRPAFLLVESAWNGNSGEWSYLLSQFRDRSPNPLADLVDYCKAEGIPTVFWNKDDPPHFETFIDAASRFDVIFTSDANCIPLYREHCRHERVHALPFAAQPRIHNPLRRPDWPTYPVCFAGSWYAERYVDRQQRLTNLLDAAAEHDLHIFDRHQALGENMYRFPDRYRPHMKGTLSYDRMLTAYRCYQVMLNANTVSDSPTMFSRRVFEALACGTPVVSTESQGMTQLLGRYARVARTADEARGHLRELLGNEALRSQEAHAAYRFVHTQHSYRRRLEEIVGKLGLPALADAGDTTVSVILCTMRPENVARCLDAFRRQQHPRKELLLVLNNGVFDVEAIRKSAAAIPEARVLHVDGPTTLGDCLNMAIKQASGAFIAKMDDDDHYGEHYLSDQVLAAGWSGADIVGKGTYFTYIEGRDTLAVRHLAAEHAFTRIVSGATLLAKRDLFKDIQFRALPRGTDSAFLIDALNNECRIYSGDRFNFILVRKPDTSVHTWQIAEEAFAAKCTDLRTGLDLARVMI